MNLISHPRLTQWVSLEEQELLNPTGHLSSPPIFIWVRVARSFVFCVVFCRLVCIPFVFFLLEQELLTLPEHLSSPPVFSGVSVTRSLVLCVCFVDRCLSIFTFSFGHCVVCSSSICGFWLPLWYLQTRLK